MALKEESRNKLIAKFEAGIKEDSISVSGNDICVLFNDYKKIIIRLKKKEDKNIELSKEIERLKEDNKRLSNECDDIKKKSEDRRKLLDKYYKEMAEDRKTIKKLKSDLQQISQNNSIVIIKSKTEDSLSNVKEEEIVEESKLVDEWNLREEINSVEDTKSVEETNLSEEINSVEDTKSVEETNLSEEINSVEDIKSVEETNLSEEINSVEDTKLVEDIKSVEETNLSEEIKLVEDIDLGEEKELVEELGKVEKSDLIEEPKLVIGVQKEGVSSIKFGDWSNVDFEGLKKEVEKCPTDEEKEKENRGNRIIDSTISSDFCINLGIQEEKVQKKEIEENLPIKKQKRHKKKRNDDVIEQVIPNYLIDLESFIIKDNIDILLQDRTSEGSIIWATDTYIELGAQYEKEREITKGYLYALDKSVLQPRVLKSIAAQKDRTKSKAEVFTPTWICNKMNNLLDKEWFGYENVFNVENESDNTWKTNTEKVRFDNGKTFEDYINSTRLEITCGEAPFLVSRYDATTGVEIEVQDRVGLLDRKLRVINENIEDKSEWFEWVKKAYKSIYGYEYQGDNLLIARINLLITFIDYYKFKFRVEPSIEEVKDIAEIISWNIWQMDGLSYKLPLADKESDLYCKIMDWDINKKIEFRNIGKEE